jgi:hypothetical protein
MACAAIYPFGKTLFKPQSSAILMGALLLLTLWEIWTAMPELA